MTLGDNNCSFGSPVALGLDALFALSNVGLYPPTVFVMEQHVCPVCLHAIQSEKEEQGSGRNSPNMLLCSYLFLTSGL